MDLGVVLNREYPLLKNGGGFDMLISQTGRKGKLNIVSNGASGVCEMRHWTTGRIYIRPLQANLLDEEGG